MKKSFKRIRDSLLTTNDIMTPTAGLAKYLFFVFILFFSVPVLPIHPVSAEETAEEQAKKKKPELLSVKYRTVTTRQGLVFRVPEDMPIEEKAGIVGPLPFDEYIYGKFEKVNSHLRRIEARLENMQKTLTLIDKNLQKERNPGAKAETSAGSQR